MELAKGIETSQAAITAWEHNKREPDVKSIKKIAKYFHIPVSELMGNHRTDSPYISIISESIEQNPKLTELFNLCRFLPNRDIDVLIGVVTAMTRGVRHNELP